MHSSAHPLERGRPPTGCATEARPRVAAQGSQLLAAGGSRSPMGLEKVVGVDLADPGFWESGLALVDEKLEAPEAAAEDVLAASGDDA